jgi:Na+-transporting methylmalonyl-CoA/oxaloacetate decarboxylase beta subunit
MPHQKLKKVFSNQAFIKILGTITLFLTLTPFFKSSAQVMFLPESTSTSFSVSPSTIINSSPSTSSLGEFSLPLVHTLPQFESLEPTPEPISFQLYLLFSFFFADFIANALVLSLGYLILKKIELIKSWRFLKYIFFVTIGGGLVNLIVIFLLNFGSPWWSIILAERKFWLGLTIPFGVYNYWLSRRIFNLNKKQAFFIGLITGISNLFPRLSFTLLFQFLVNLIIPPRGELIL